MWMSVPTILTMIERHPQIRVVKQEDIPSPAKMPVVLDFATSGMALNEVRVARNESRHVAPRSITTHEDLGPSMPGQGLFQAFQAELHIHGVRHSPGQHLPCRPIRHHDQIQEAPAHGYVGRRTRPGSVD
jgi:hypothetical protein